MSEANSYKYWAFISYSHRDKTWGDWLHHGLETYRVPRALVGAPLPGGGSVPARIFPVFRDREELPTAADLGGNLRNAIEQSRYLVVICSPHSARSRWVNEEILSFKRLGREQRILGVVVEGTPFAADAAAECLPPALRFRLGADGELSTGQADPILADARPTGEGKERALLTLLASVAGVKRDELERRHRSRQRQRRLVLVAAAGVAVVLAVLIQRRFAETKRDEQFQAAQAELSRARKALAEGRPTEAAERARAASALAEQSGRSLDPAQSILRRALDATDVERTWDAHRAQVDGISFDPQGRRLLSFSGSSGEAAVWDAGTGRRLATLAAGDVRAARWLDGGNEVVSVAGYWDEASNRQSIEVAWWDPATGAARRKKQFPGHAMPRPELGADDANAWVALTDAATPGSLRLVRLRDGFSDINLPPSNEARRRVAFVPGAEVALEIAPATGVRLFSLADGRLLGALEGVAPDPTLDLASIVASVDGTAIAAQVVKSRTRWVATGVWNARDGTLRAKYVPTAQERLFAFLRADDNALYCSHAEMLSVISPHLGRRPVLATTARTAVLAWSAGTKDSGPLAAFADAGSGLVLWHASFGIERGFPDAAGRLNAIALPPDGTRLAVANDRGAVGIWRTTVPLVRESLIDRAVKLVAAPEGDGRVLLRTGFSSMEVWDVGARRVHAVGKQLGPDRRHYGNFLEWETPPGFTPSESHWLHYDWNPRADWVVATPDKPDAESVATFHDTKTGEFLGRHPFREPIQLAPHGRVAVARTANDGWELLRATSGGLVAQPVQTAPLREQAWSRAAAFNADGTRLYLSPADGWIEVFATDPLRSLERFRFAAERDNATVYRLLLHPGGRWLLAQGGSLCWKVDLARHETTPVLQGDEYPSRVTLTPDGNRLIGLRKSGVRWWTFPDLTPMADVAGGYAVEQAMELPGGEALLLREYVSGAAVVGLRDGKVQRRFDHVVGSDARVGLAVVRTGDDSAIVRLHDGETLVDLPGVRPLKAGFAADGSRVALVLFPDDRLVSVAVRPGAAAAKQPAHAK